MSMERKYRGAVRKIKKRDAQLAKEGTTAGKQAAERRSRIEAARSLSAAQMDPAADKAKNAYQPEAEEGVLCRVNGCTTKIVGSLSDLVAHRESHN